jgi:peptidoglycan/xylan/chitin deacetylase (PgdA/CDA1 family)
MATFLSPSSLSQPLEDATGLSRLLICMISPSDNRAVSALFRVFGGEGEPVIADTQELAIGRGMHRGETMALAVLVPLTVAAALGEPLAEWLGTAVGWMLAIPLGFLALNLLPFLFGARTPAMQWLVWLATSLAWAFFRRHAGGVAGLLSYAWIGVGVMNLAAACVLAWRASMGWQGTPGNVWRMLVITILHAAAVGVGLKWGWQWGLLSAFAIGLAWCCAVLDPACQWLGPVYRKMDSDKILITIDDGPDPHDTPILLDLLDRYQTKAIFFMIGEKVRAYPELAREVIRRGHEIGNHTMNHPQASFWCASPWRTYREIACCQEVIEEITGTKPRWFRAPVGHRNLFTHPIAGALGLRVMGWSRRGFDAVEKDAGKVLVRILPKLTGGDIVLLHESTPIAPEVLAGVLVAAGKLPEEKFTG